MRLSQLTASLTEEGTGAASETHLVLRWGEVNVRWHAYLWTPLMEEQIAAADDENKGRVLVAVLTKLIVSWDFQRDDGEPWPTTPDELSKLPTVFLSAVAEGLSDDVVPKEESEQPSPDISKPEASSAKHRNGTGSSRRRNGSACRRGR